MFSLNTSRVILFRRTDGRLRAKPIKKGDISISFFAFFPFWSTLNACGVWNQNRNVGSVKYQKNKTGMIDKVKRSFLRMTSPFEFGSSRRSGSLASINFPPEMAQRDAAYFCALKLLRVNLFACSDEERRNIYSLAEMLIGISLEKAERIHRAGQNERRSLEYPEMIQFVTLVRNLLGTLSDLADYQYYIDRSEDGMANFFGNKVISNFKISDGTFSNSEIGIYNLLVGMLDDAESTVLASQAQTRKLLTKTEMERYEKAYASYLRVFEKLDPQNPHFTVEM